MSYVPGERVTTQDYLNLIGGQSSTTPFPSEAAAAQKLSGIYGVGYGQYGYMQTITHPLTRPAEGRVRASDWADLQAAFEDCLLHQGQSTAGLPAAIFFDVGDEVIAHDGHGTVGDWTSHLPTIDNATNRLSDPRTNAASYTLVGPLLTDIRSSTWQSETISSHPIFTWPTGDHARAFFNAGCEIVLKNSHPNGTNAIDDYLRNQMADYGDFHYGRDYIRFTGPNPPPVSAPEGYWNATSPGVRMVSEWSTIYFGILFYHERITGANVSGNGDNGSSLELFVAWRENGSLRPPGITPPAASGTRLDVYVLAPVYLPDSLVPVVTISNTFDI